MSVRMAKEEDIAQILEIYGPYILNTAVSFEYTVPSLEAFTQRYRAITDQFPWLVWEEQEQILGYAYGSAPFERAAFQWCAEASIYLRPEAQGQGIGKALYRELESLLRQQGYLKVYAIITSENQNSVEFHKAVGYTHVADMPGCGFKLGRWHGIIWMEKLLTPVDLPSVPPVSIESIVKNNGNSFQVLDKMPLS